MSSEDLVDAQRTGVGRALVRAVLEPYAAVRHASTGERRHG